ncbi:ATPase family aaa domain-containing protein 1-a [Neofusicoccum parvum]|uniref:ATPase family aaa domain-containing protein 1-a n=1 Tax=Neofusicoccum parvum TaxID=310453 RepID=A0ACB5SJQ5_9PEZI|nr:ATPase family aaa domain-containing protein 1-a [Neofusicoccum parvum]
MEEWTSQVEGGSFEEVMLQCIVNTDSIPSNYEHVCIKPSTIQELERITTLSLQRPKAFSHGVLQGHRITGALLYGPPGCGKTSLCWSVAKQSGFNILAPGPVDIWQARARNNERAVKAVFNLARIMHPCIIFIDEADAIFPSRSYDDTRSQRNAFSLFLMEWDSFMTDPTSPFLLLATNRPYDLDPAVLHRAPVQIYLDVPVTEERAGILSILLKRETLASDVSIPDLAELTPDYTGSDLKNLCVAAALQCIQKQPRDTRSRILVKQHFISALESIKASRVHKSTNAKMEKFHQGSK